MISPDHVFYKVQFSETFSHAKVEAENGQPSLRVAATTSVISLLSSTLTSVIIVYHHWKPKAATTPAISIWLFHRIICSSICSYILSFALFLVDCLSPVYERVLGSRPSIAAHPQTLPVRSPLLCQALDHLCFYSYQLIDVLYFSVNIRMIEKWRPYAGARNILPRAENTFLAWNSALFWSR